MPEHTDQPITTVRVPDDLIPADVELVGIDGNAFAIIGAVSKGLRRAGNSPDVVRSFTEQAMSSDYDHVLRCAIAFVANPFEDNDD